MILHSNISEMCSIGHNYLFAYSDKGQSWLGRRNSIGYAKVSLDGEIEDRAWRIGKCSS